MAHQRAIVSMQKSMETRAAMGQLKIDNPVAHFAGRPLFPPV
jgi:hypothetical protein